MQATVVITTKNRREDLLKAVASALSQTARPEVLVIDDGSTDGTSEAVAREFPSARRHRSEQSLGYIVQRNRGARLASNPVIISIDDDAAFSTPLVVEQTLREFDHPQVGAVAIPFIDVNRSSAVKQKAPRRNSIFAAYSFIGTAHALRRDVFLRLDGYRAALIHQGEEEDYSLRMLDAGWITRCGNADSIHHFESPRRSWSRMDYYGPRNKILHAWQNVPRPYFAAHASAVTVRMVSHTLSPARMFTRLRGITAAYQLICARKFLRAPVRPETYKLARELKQRGAVALGEIIHRLSATPAPILENDHCIATTIS